MAKADIPALKELPGLLRTIGKQPDGVTLLPWKQGKCVMWEVTVSDTLARDVPDSRRSSRGGSRKEKKQVLLTKPIVLVCSNCGRNDGGHQQRRDGLFDRTWKAHHTMYR